jgi:hypothetical protein
MKVGDLVKLKFRGNGHPGAGLIVDDVDVESSPSHHREYLILWDMPEWSMSRWRERELEVINDSKS